MLDFPLKLGLEHAHGMIGLPIGTLYSDMGVDWPDSGDFLMVSPFHWLKDFLVGYEVLSE